MEQEKKINRINVIMNDEFIINWLNRPYNQIDNLYLSIIDNNPEIKQFLSKVEDHAKECETRKEFYQALAIERAVFFLAVGLNPRDLVVDLNKLSDTLMKYYNEEDWKMQHALLNIENRISIVVGGSISFRIILN